MNEAKRGWQTEKGIIAFALKLLWFQEKVGYEREERVKM